MAAEEDHLDIDIYGEDGDENADYNQGAEDYAFDDETGLTQTESHIDIVTDDPPPAYSPNSQPPKVETAPSQPQPPAQQQGTKRKESSDERSVDPNSTSALMISELHWWTTEDDIRGWAAQAHSEDELKDVTFSEHKVNGKSKGQAYVDFESAAAATATKHVIERLADDKPSRKFTVNYTNHLHNPFKTNPKDAPARKEESRRGAYNNGPPHQPSYSTNNFRGRGGGVGSYNHRGNYNNSGGNFNNNRNFSGGGMNMNPNGAGGYNQNVGGGFQSNPMMTGFNNGFNRGGGGMAMRGGRGGGGMMNPGMGMPMGGMPMGMGMGMNPMMGGMGMGFQGGFNPAMFQGQAGWGGVPQQQGGPNKRQRQE